MIFTKPELAALAALRARFLDGSNAGGGYWKNENDLALYDASFGERIGWKWDAVLGELQARGWRPTAKNVVDWGCGSGIAGRRVLGAWAGLESLTLTDVSAHAMRFAEAKARENFPSVRTRMKADAADAVAGSLLLVSHVLNETDDDAAHRLIAAARRAEEIIWVEAGTHADSRRLISVREKLREEFDIIAPCTHAARCGMLGPENAGHWCHHFARVPSEASRDARWAQFGRELGIDMGTLPYSFLVLARRGTSEKMAPGFS
ncbi:MAG: small ribosomal subunit Rsm22 family protein, partial [Chthoniobacteraceae bacterium]